jgi:hypothetical protein
MSATETFPLLLELSQPMKPSASQQDLLKESLGIKYNPLTQVNETPPRMGGTVVETVYSFPVTTKNVDQFGNDHGTTTDYNGEQFDYND